MEIQGFPVQDTRFQNLANSLILLSLFQKIDIKYWNHRVLLIVKRDNIESLIVVPDTI